MTTEKIDIRQSDKFLRSDLFKDLSGEESQVNMPQGNTSSPPKYNLLEVATKWGSISQFMDKIGKEIEQILGLEKFNKLKILLNQYLNPQFLKEFKASFTREDLEELKQKRISPAVQQFLDPKQYAEIIARKMEEGYEKMKKSSTVKEAAEKKLDLLEIATQLKTFAEKLEEEYRTSLVKNQRFTGKRK